MDIEEFRRAGYKVIDQICDYYSTLQERTVKSDVEPGFLINQLPKHAPQQPEPIDNVISDFQTTIVPGMTHWQHAKFFGYFPSIVTFESILADMLSSSVSQPGFNWACSPASTELEQVVMDWMAGVLGLDDVFLSSGRGGGVISNTASESALTAAIAARERALRRLTRTESQGDRSAKRIKLDDTADTAEPNGVSANGVNGAAGSASVPAAGVDITDDSPIDVSQSIRDANTPKLIMYGSTQTHSLGAKAAKILGITFRALPVSKEDNYALRGDTLRRAVAADVEAGLLPFFVIGTVGTTSSGAVDYIGEIGEVVRDYPTLFLHVDAAWAGMAYALPEQRGPLRLAEVNAYADSFCTNAHKWGLVGFDCSLFFVRNRRDLTEALDVTPLYLRTKEADSGAVVDYRNWQLALGRRFRSVKVWFVLRGYGVEGLQKHLRNGIECCKELGQVIASSPNYEIVTPPMLGLVDFRLVPPGETLSETELNSLNQTLQKRLEHRADVILTQTVLKSSLPGTPQSEVFCIRFAIGSLRSTMQDVLDVWNEVEAEGAKVLAERGQ